MEKLLEFDKSAQTIHDEISSKLKGTAIYKVYNISYKEDGEISLAILEFEDANPYIISSIIYNPNHRIKNMGIPACEGEMEHLKLDDNWYYECLDWN
ncbi:MAG: hypothetical protein GWP15_02535 [Nitrospirae bacterium]|nr:hypothetical protein [Nitrospirota bacterium]